jgi:hypothetical protein
MDFPKGPPAVSCGWENGKTKNKGTLAAGIINKTGAHAIFL